MTLPDSLEAKLSHWLSRDPDPASRRQLDDLRRRGEVRELELRFGARLEFGTAGLRGIVGAGPARMNRLVVLETTTGLARYLETSVANAHERGVVVTYDARPDSAQFAQDTTRVLLGCGFRVFLTVAPQPTPVGAFAVLHLGAAAGVVITASHNPPEYNGYKVYWENGAQIIPPHDDAIAARIDAAAKAELPLLEIDAGAASGQLQWLDTPFIEQYVAAIESRIKPWQPKKTPPMRIAYTALHGVGAQLAETVLHKLQLGHVDSVPSQREPDGAFPTVAFPNPEEPGAMDAVIALAAANEASLAVANDPDADRLAVAARDETGQYVSLTGDQVGVLLGDYCLRHSRDPSATILCASLVSSRLLGRIAEAAGATYFETLTGFKWLANVALEHQTDARRFLFAYEEALGYAIGELVNDKDGLSALALFAQMTAELKARGHTVFDQLERLYRRHGVFLTTLRSLTSASDAPVLTDALRAAAPAEIAGQAVCSTKDLKRRQHRFANGDHSALDNHPSDVLVYYLEDDSRVIVRPSGTEPKTKCYYEVIEPFADGDNYAATLSKCRQRLGSLVERHQAELAAVLSK